MSSSHYDQSHTNESGDSFSTRLEEPEGFHREPASKGSFGEFLRNQRLKPAGSPVLLFDGTRKRSEVHAAVLDMDVGNRDLQQCADAVMRLRAEYLYAKGLYSEIGFHFTNGFYATYAKWRAGYFIKVKGNDVSWVKSWEDQSSYSSFRTYLNMVFSYCGTRSLEKEMKPVHLDRLEIGDVFIQGGSPGHAIIIVDMLIDDNGRKKVLLAQSYMPAQEIHVLKNFWGEEDWYEVGTGERLRTPEWEFDCSDARGW